LYTILSTCFTFKEAQNLRRFEFQNMQKKERNLKLIGMIEESLVVFIQPEIYHHRLMLCFDSHTRLDRAEVGPPQAPQGDALVHGASQTRYQTEGHRQSPSRRAGDVA